MGSHDRAGAAVTDVKALHPAIAPVCDECKRYPSAWVIISDDPDAENGFLCRVCMAVTQMQQDDPVNAPRHYRSHPSGVECIQITEHMSFCLGNAVKYIWRADEKGNAVEDLRKARWYIDREIERRTRQAGS